MSERIKNMTVQQLIDAGFKISLVKGNCGDNPALDAKQWIDAPVGNGYNGRLWASNHSDTTCPNPEIIFCK